MKDSYISEGQAEKERKARQEQQEQVRTAKELRKEAEDAARQGAARQRETGGDPRPLQP